MYASTASRYFGLDRSVKFRNLMAIAATAWFSISVIVFLNASTSFALVVLLHASSEHLGATTANLILVDQIVALPLVLLWGRLADIVGVRLVSVIGYSLFAAGLVAFAHSQTTMQAYLCRILLSTGVSALTTMLSGVLASMTAPLQVCRADLEQESLLHSTALPTADGPPATVSAADRSARLAGILGTMSGLGAVFAVFALLRLPPALAAWHKDGTSKAALRQGLMETYYIVAVLTALFGWSLLYLLKRKYEPLFFVHRMSAPTGSPSRILAVFEGFRIALKNPGLSVGFVAGFAARAISILVSVFIPLYVAQYFISTGDCHLDQPSVPSDVLKEDCRKAFSLASALAGTVQLVALLASPAAGFAAARWSQTRLLASGGSIGSLGLAMFALAPSPHSPLCWSATCLIGLAEAILIVISTAACARCRARLAVQPLSQGRPTTKEIAGAISGAYSLFGAAGILAAGLLGGYAADISSRGPFVLGSVIAFTVPFTAVVVHVLQ